MGRLEDISAAELRDYLDDIDETRPLLRLIVGINYKEGIPATRLADWYDVSESTIHNWLNRLERLENEPIDDVLYDAPRSGRPRKLSSEEWDELVQVLDNPPDSMGIDAPHWTPDLVQQFIEEEFDTEYSRRHVQDLLHEAGFTWKTARPEYVKGDERARTAFKEGFKKTDAEER